MKKIHFTTVKHCFFSNSMILIDVLSGNLLPLPYIYIWYYIWLYMYVFIIPQKYTKIDNLNQFNNLRFDSSIFWFKLGISVSRAAAFLSLARALHFIPSIPTVKYSSMAGEWMTVKARFVSSLSFVEETEGTRKSSLILFWPARNHSGHGQLLTAVQRSLEQFESIQIHSKFKSNFQTISNPISSAFHKRHNPVLFSCCNSWKVSCEEHRHKQAQKAQQTFTNHLFPKNKTDPWEWVPEVVCTPHCDDSWHSSFINEWRSFWIFLCICTLA